MSAISFADILKREYGRTYTLENLKEEADDLPDAYETLVTVPKARLHFEDFNLPAAAETCPRSGNPDSADACTCLLRYRLSMGRSTGKVETHKKLYAYLFEHDTMYAFFRFENEPLPRHSKDTINRAGNPAYDSPTWPRIRLDCPMYPTTTWIGTIVKIRFLQEGFIKAFIWGPVTRPEYFGICTKLHEAIQAENLLAEKAAQLGLSIETLFESLQMTDSGPLRLPADCGSILDFLVLRSLA